MVFDALEWAFSVHKRTLRTAAYLAHRGHPWYHHHNLSPHSDHPRPSIGLLHLVYIGLYVGTVALALRDAPFSGIYLVIYMQIKGRRVLDNHSDWPIHSDSCHQHHPSPFTPPYPLSNNILLSNTTLQPRSLSRHHCSLHNHAHSRTRRPTCQTWRH
jgi:hypothetical protein